MASIQLINLDKNKVGGELDYDVVKNYPWTITESKQRINVPYIVLEEFEQDVSTLWASLNYWFTQTTKSGNLSEVDNPYQGLYSANKTGAKFTLPYFEEYDHNITQNWNPSKGLLEGSIAGGVATAIQNLEKMFKRAPGTNINQQRVWEGSGPASYTVNFHLFNTIHQDDYKMNMALRDRLLLSSLHDQRTAILISPPALFSIKIPGIRVSPAAVISNVTVSNVGQMNLIDNKNIPDAYKLSITITELIVESRQILKDRIDNTNKIVAIDTTNKYTGDKQIAAATALIAKNTANIVKEDAAKTVGK